jgi:rhamnosyltransferase
MRTDICGVIVTYHPDEDFAHRVSVLTGQVGGLVVVDNRSADNELVWLRDLSRRYAFTLLENSENLGLGSALNRGVRWAAEQGQFRFVALFDQDSAVTEGFIDSLVACIERHPEPERIAVAAPRLFLSNIGVVFPPPGTLLCKVAQTSGSLMPLSVFDSQNGSNQGWFNEDLFIDYVDYEYCLRVTAAGWMILRCDQALLTHSPGNCERHTLFGLYAGTTLSYSPYRHYYSTRNAAWVMMRYWRQHPGWCAAEAFRLIKEKLKLCIWERERKAKLAFSLRGLKDGLKGKLGKREISD